MEGGADRIASTPAPPYYAVIFTSIRTGVDDGYGDAARRMVERAATMPGFLGVESARETVGITVSYWRSLDDIARWRDDAEHRAVRRMGRDRWYAAFTTRICRVERDYGFESA